MTLLDSSVWIAYLNVEDSQYAKAKREMASASLPIILPEYVILEVCTVLAMRAGKDIADRFLELVSDNKDVRVLLTDPRFFDDLIGLYRSLPGKALSFADAALLLLADQFKTITFDVRLRAAIRRRSRGLS